MLLTRCSSANFHFRHPEVAAEGCPRRMERPNGGPSRLASLPPQGDGESGKDRDDGRELKACHDFGRACRAPDGAALPSDGRRRAVSVRDCRASAAAPLFPQLGPVLQPLPDLALEAAFRWIVELLAGE